jgi:ABC-2 type transport system permease protein
MKKLLSIEFTKLKKLNSLKIIFAVYMCMVPLWMYFLSNSYMTFIHPIMPILKNIWAFPDIWRFTTYSASFFNVLMGVTLVIVVCNEYNYRTFKQNVIDGLSKKEVIFSKFLVVFVLSSLVTLYTILLALIFGLINSSFDSVFENSYYVIIYFLQTLCYFSFAFFFAVLVKKTALSIIFFIVSFIAETIIGAFLGVAGLTKVYLYFPLNVFSTLTPSPLMEEFNRLSVQESGQEIVKLDLWMNVVISILYMAIFFVISYQTIKKRDL